MVNHSLLRRCCRTMCQTFGQIVALNNTPKPEKQFALCNQWCWVLLEFYTHMAEGGGGGGGGKLYLRDRLVELLRHEIYSSTLSMPFPGVRTGATRGSLVRSSGAGIYLI